MLVPVLSPLCRMRCCRYDRLVLALSSVLHAGPGSRVARPIRGGILKRVGLPHETSFKWGLFARPGRGPGGAQLQGQLLDPGPVGGDVLEALPPRLRVARVGWSLQTLSLIHI